MPPYREMDNRGNEHEQPTCFCGPFKTDVQKAAFVIAFIGGAISLIQAIVCFLPDSSTHHQNVAMGMANAIGALMYFSIILAQRQRNQLLFLPYLIYVGIGLVAGAVMCLVVLGLGVVAPQSFIDEWNKEHPTMTVTREQFRAFMIGYFFLSALALALNAWFYSIVYRAYKSLKNQLLGVPPPV